MRRRLGEGEVARERLDRAVDLAADVARTTPGSHAAAVAVFRFRQALGHYVKHRGRERWVLRVTLERAFRELWARGRETGRAELWTTRALRDVRKKIARGEHG